MENNTDKLLEKAFFEGNEKALKTVYGNYKSEFVNYFRKYNINTEDLLDIYQDSIIVVYQKFSNKKVELKNSSLKTYLYGIAKNKIYDYFKLKNYKTNDFEDLKVNDKEFELKKEPSLYEKLLAKHLKSISESCQEVLRLYYYRNLSIKEIVLKTDYKDENTVKSHKSRCLKRLKALCQNDKDE